MEEDEDIENFEEGYQGRFQNSYLVLEKRLPGNTQNYEDSEMEDVSQQSNSGYEKYKGVVASKNTGIEKPHQTFEMGVSTSNAFMRENKYDLQKQRGSPQPPANNDDSSILSSSVGRENKVLSTSSKQRNSYYSKPLLIKTGSERKSMAHWIDSEKEEFKRQLSVYGKDWRKISDIITNKTEKQIRNFYQNYKKKMKLEDLLPSKDRIGTSQSNNGRDSPENKHKQNNKF